MISPTRFINERFIPPVLFRAYKNAKPSYIHISKLPDLKEITSIFFSLKKYFIVPTIIMASGYSFVLSLKKIVVQKTENFKKNITHLCFTTLDLAKDISLLLMLFKFSAFAIKSIKAFGGFAALFLYAWDLKINLETYKSLGPLYSFTVISSKDYLENDNPNDSTEPTEQANYHNSVRKFRIFSLIKMITAIAGIAISIIVFIGLLVGTNFFAPSLYIIINSVHMALDWLSYFFETT